MAVVLEEKTTKRTWEQACIKDVCEFIVDCVNKTAPAVDYETEFKMIRTTNVKNGWVNLEQVKYVTEETFDKWNRRATPKTGDVILTREAPLGEVGILRSQEKVFLGQRLVLYRVNPELLDKHFLLYALMSAEVQGQIKSYGSGSTVEHMRVPDCEKINLPYPPVETQRKIGSILSSYDDLIENNLRRIKLLEDMAQALYREWFVHFRYPGHEQVPLVDSTLGPIPGGWEVKAASAAMEINPRTQVSREGLNPFITMDSLSTNSMVIRNVTQKQGNSGSKFKNGDTLFARITPCLENGKTGFVQFLSCDEQTACGSTEFIVLRSRTLTQEFVYLLARTEDFRNNAIQSMSGASGRQRVHSGCFDKYLLVNPDNETLQKFSEITDPMFKLIHSLSMKTENLRQTRDLLLPRLISGQLDVSEMEVV